MGERARFGGKLAQPAQAGVKHVAQAVTEQIEAEDAKHDRRTGRDHQPRRVFG